MAKQDVDKDLVNISIIPPPDSAIKQVDNVYIVVTQAFCPAGHNLVSDDNEQFDGYPGIKLLLESGDQSGEIYLSPFHGDGSKKGKTDWQKNTKLSIKCPHCHVELPKLATCHCSIDSSRDSNKDSKTQQNGDLIKLFLSNNLTDSHILALCNVWGCRRSQTIDNWNIISEFLDGQIS